MGIHSPRWQKWARQVLQQSRPDVVHTNTIVGITPAIWRAAAHQSRPVVHTCHDYHLLCPRTTLLRSNGQVCETPPLPCRWLARAKLTASHLVNVVTAPSRFVLEKHLAAGGFGRARAEVVPNACPDIPDQIPEREGLPWIQGLFLGQINQHKGIPLLLAALRTVFANSPSDRFRFAFAGNGPLVAEVKALCDRFAPRCRYLGVVQGTEKTVLMDQSSFLVLPSIWHDNFPMVILESFAQGLPVIGTRRGGIPEIIDAGRNGLVVEPDAPALVKALLCYAGKDTVRLAHGRAAREKAGQYSVARHVGKFQKIYTDLTQQAN
jgi:glycosyltransferase involved in cell wall biosynthesis